MNYSAFWFFKKHIGYFHRTIFRYLCDESLE